MTQAIRRIQLSGSRAKCIHLEAKGCIINIRQNLKDDRGRSVTSIEILADNYSGEEWNFPYLTGKSQTIMVREGKEVKL